MSSEKATKIINRRYTAGIENDFETLRNEVIRLKAVNAELLELAVLVSNGMVDAKTLRELASAAIAKAKEAK